MKQNSGLWRRGLWGHGQQCVEVYVPDAERRPAFLSSLFVVLSIAGLVVIRHGLHSWVAKLGFTGGQQRAQSNTDGKW